MREPRTSSEYDDTQGSTALEKFWIRDYSFDTYLWYDEITDFDPNSDEETLDAELDKGVSESRLEDWIETRKYFELMKTFELTAAGNPRIGFTSLTTQKNGSNLPNPVYLLAMGWNFTE